MHVPKKRVLLALALAVMAVLLLAPAAALAAPHNSIEINGGAPYIGVPTVDLAFQSDDVNAVQVSFSARLNADPWTPETPREAYLTQQVQQKLNWPLPVAPANGDVVEVRVTFYNGANVALGSFTTTTIYDDGKLYSQLAFTGGSMGSQGYLWYPGGDVYGDFSVTGAAPQHSIVYKVDGLPTNGIDLLPADWLNRNLGTWTMPWQNGIHSVSHYAVNASMVTGPVSVDYFGIDTMVPTITTTGFDSAYHSDKVDFTARVQDNGGSGVANVSVSSSAALSGVVVASLPWDPWTFTVKGTVDKPAASGQYWVDFDVTDVVGNTWTYTFLLNFDVEAPHTTYTIDPIGADTFFGWTNKDVTLTFIANDPGGAGVDYTEYIIGDYKTTPPAPSVQGTKVVGGKLVITETAAEGPVYVWFRSVDKAVPPNAEPYQLVMVYIDKVAPTLTCEFDAGDQWYNTDFEVYFTASDANSGIAAPGIEFSIPTWDGFWALGGIDNGWYAGPGFYFDVDWVSHTTDGIFPVKARVSDKAGNLTQIACEAKVDTRPPVTDGAAGWIKGGVPYTLTATDQATGAGVAATLYRVDQSTPWLVNEAATPGVTLTTDVTINGANGSVHTVDFASVDNARPWWWFPAVGWEEGNFEGQTLTPVGQDDWGITGYQTRTVKIDSAAPTTSVVGNDDEWHKTAVTLFFTGADAESGVAYTEWSLDGTNWTKGTQAVVSKNGVVTVSYRSVDMVGNVEATKTVVVKVATKAPVAKAWPATAKAGKKVALRYRVSAVTAKADVVITIRNAKGIVIRSYNLANRATNKILTYNISPRLKAGAYRIVVTAVDEAGNIQSARGLAKLTVKK